MCRKMSGGMFQKWTFTFCLSCWICKNWGCICLSPGPVWCRAPWRRAWCRWFGTWSPEKEWGSEMGTGRGKPTSGCVQAVQVGDGSCLPRGLVWRPGDWSGIHWLGALVSTNTRNLSSLYLQGPVGPWSIQKGPGPDGSERHASPLRWGPISTGWLSFQNCPQLWLKSEVKTGNGRHLVGYWFFKNG